MRPVAERFERIGPGAERDALLPLFHLADDSESQLRSYYQCGDLFALREADGRVIGMALVIPADNGDVELNRWRSHRGGNAAASVVD